MSIVTPAVSVTAGRATQLPPPGAARYGEVIIANLSGYALTVAVGAATGYLPPWCAETFTLPSNGAQVVTVFPSQLSGTFPSGSSTTVLATWYAEGEKVEGAYPISLVANALAASVSGGTITLDGQVPVVNGTPSPLAVGGTVTTVPPLATGPQSGQVRVGTTGTETQLPAIACTATGLLVAALPGNSGPVAVGPNGVTTSNGLLLGPGSQPVLVSVDNAARLFVTGTSGDGISFLTM